MFAARPCVRIAASAMLAMTGCGQILGYDGDYGDQVVGDGDAEPGSEGSTANDASGEADATAIAVDASGFDQAGPEASGAEDAGTAVLLDGARVDAAPDGAVVEIAHVQNVVQIGDGTSLTAEFSSDVHAGDLLVGAFHGGGTVSVSDGVNGAWTQILGVNTDYLFYYANSGVADAGSLVITINASSSGSLRISADEFSGVATSSALDAQSTGPGDGGTTWNAGTTSSIAAGELVYVGAGTAANDELFTPLSTAGVALTVGGQITSTASGTIFSAYVLSSAAGVQNATATVAPSVGAGINGGQATFRP